ncbi:unnamed protein product [Echinostoma caproni]|uniref:Outer dynein arm-docking complex subunit 4 n=1 Tax=Echinostoma caproni TaxID=27848 RepID=A0A183AD00_9TREM|nr:unnamed protein product [Echinostoma caproni]
MASQKDSVCSPFKGLLQKAQVLYNRGEFEYALMFFHRGHSKRPELQEFRIGIQKCEEAIKNSLQHTKGLCVTEEGSAAFRAEMDEKPQKRPTVKNGKKGERDKTSDDVPFHVLPPAKSRAFFGYLYEDHEYLKNLIHQEAVNKWKTTCSEEVRQIARNGLNYLDARSQFWHQERPIYARRKPRSLRRDKAKEKAAIATGQGLTIYQVLEKLHEIDKCQRSDDHGMAIRLAELLRAEVGQWSDEQCPNRLEVLANVNSMLGLSYLESERLEEALEAHEQAYALGKRCDLPEIVAHAVDNIGRVYAKKGDYQAAIDVWEKKLDDTDDQYELIWLHYEIGRCHLELEHSDRALDHGLSALHLAKQMSDEAWQLNITVLIGQSNLQMQKRSDALEAFRSAQELAKSLNAGDAERAIAQVMDEFEGTDFEVETDTLTQDDSVFDKTPTIREYPYIDL